MAEKENIRDTVLLWQDRPRFMGIPLSFTRYGLSDEKLFVRTGMTDYDLYTVQLQDVSEPELSQNAWQKIFGTGTLVIHSSDKSCPLLTLKNIRHPRDVLLLIEHKSEHRRELRRQNLLRALPLRIPPEA